MRTGDVLADRFRIEERIGAGGMGTVYRARDERGGLVALKVMHAGEGAHARFAREVEALAELTHPNIVRYVAHGEATDGQPFVAMEWLEGETLSRRLARATFSVADCIAFGVRLGEALGAAHARGIVHRDVKPANIMMVGERPEEFKLLDFGLARRAGDVGVTRAGMMLGTPGYMAPEQARGDADIDARADVFALGCVLFRCLTGKMAFPGEDAVAVLAKILFERPQSAKQLRDDVPAELDAIIARLLSKEKSQRPAHGGAAAALLAALEPHSVSIPCPAVSSTTLTSHERRFSSIVLVREELETVTDGMIAHSNKAGEVVLRHGGHYERLADGSLVAVLSGRSATEQAANAARCALAMRAVIRAPMALATARAELTSEHPLGEVIDRAARLLRGVSSPVIRLDEITAGLLDATFDVSKDLTLDGERELVEAPRTLLGKVTPFVGRARELGALTSLLDECIDEPVARVALVTGPPGIGKSRLRQELMHKIRERGEPVQVWVARGDSINSGTSLGMLGQMIRRTAGLRDGAPADAKERALVARVARTVPADACERVAELIGEIANVPFAEPSPRLRAARGDAILLGEQMRRAWHELVRAECERGPLVMILEDLHWGDMPSVKFIDAVLRDLHDRPLFVVAFARNEVTDIFPGLWAERGLVPIPLSELTRKASERLVRDVLGASATPQLVERVALRAAGNAFYLEELIRSVASGDRGEMPETVLAMVEARLNALEPEARRILRAASIFGEVFWSGGVETLVGEHAMGSAEWLVELERREVIALRSEARFPGQREYAFRHALVRDAAYGMLTDADRTIGHRVAGDWLVGVGETDALTLAEHFERGRDPRAIEHYRRAAAQALAANDLDGVLARVERAIRAGARGEERGRLLLLETEAHRWRGDSAAAARCSAQAAELLPRGSREWWGAMSELISTRFRIGEHEGLRELGHELLDAPVDGAARAGVSAMLRLANVFRNAGDLALADRMLSRAEREWKDGFDDDPLVAARLQMALGLQALHLGDPSGLRERMLAAAERFERAGDERGTLVCRVNVGYASHELGLYDEAITVLRDVSVRARCLGLREVFAGADHNLALALVRKGMLDEALRMQSEACASVGVVGNQRVEVGCRVALAEIHLRAGNVPAAEREAWLAIDASRDAAPTRVLALAALANVLLADRRPADALAAARKAYALLEQLGGLEQGENHVRLVYAKALYEAGERALARAAILEARDRLHARAERIRDANLRKSFLENVQENAETIALAAAWA